MKHLLAAMLAPLAVAAMTSMLMAHGPRGSGGSGHSGFRPVSGYSSSSTRKIDSNGSSHYRTTSSGPGTAIVKKTNGTGTVGKYVKGPGNKGSVSLNQYASTYGVKFKGGFYYKGKSHQHWAYRCYSKPYRCWCWYCPSTCGWYYWCGTRDSYLPVSYIQVAPPAKAESQQPGEADLPPEGDKVQDLTPGKQQLPQDTEEPELQVVEQPKPQTSKKPKLPQIAERKQQVGDLPLEVTDR